MLIPILFSLKDFDISVLNELQIIGTPQDNSSPIFVGYDACNEKFFFK